VIGGSPLMIGEPRVSARGFCERHILRTSGTFHAAMDKVMDITSKLYQPFFGRNREIPEPPW
jgi:hypothetical protein